MMFNEFIKVLVTILIAVPHTAYSTEAGYKLNTKLCAEYNNGYIYYYRDNGDQSVLMRTDIKNNIEEKLATTNKMSDIRIYNNFVYYIGENSFDIYSINLDTLKENKIYTLDKFSLSMPTNDFIISDSKVVYSYNGMIDIKDGKKDYKIYNTGDFFADRTDMYFVDISEACIKKVIDYTNDNYEKIIDLEMLRNKNMSRGKLETISKISVYDDKVYFLAGDGFYTGLFLYDLATGNIVSITENSVTEYQVINNQVFYREKEIESKKTYLKKYNIETRQHEIIVENIRTFNMIDEHSFMYALPKDTTLYIYDSTNDSITEINNVILY